MDQSACSWIHLHWKHMCHDRFKDLLCICLAHDSYICRPIVEVNVTVPYIIRFLLGAILAQWTQFMSCLLGVKFTDFSARWIGVARTVLWSINVHSSGITSYILSNQKSVVPFRRSLTSTQESQIDFRLAVHVFSICWNVMLSTSNS